MARVPHRCANYVIKTPHFSVSSAERLVEVMQAKGTDLILTDCAHIGNAGVGLMYAEWLAPPVGPPSVSFSAGSHVDATLHDLARCRRGHQLGGISATAGRALAYCGPRELQDDYPQAHRDNLLPCSWNAPQVLGQPRELTHLAVKTAASYQTSFTWALR
jgi:hypothetical protein